MTRATQQQLARALGIPVKNFSRSLQELWLRGLIVKGGYASQSNGQRGSLIWGLAPPKVTYSLDEPRDPRQQLAPAAKRGWGAQRVLEVIEGLGGRASQAQIARQLGTTPESVRSHCKQLEQLGKLERAGLDKSGSNRGSQVWTLPARKTRQTSGPGWRTMVVSLPPDKGR